MAWLLTIPGALLTIALLVTIHEFGHMIVAKFFGVHVRVFSVGFGNALWSFRFRGTEYRLSAIPFGGYVRWAGGDPFSEGGVEEEGEEPVPHDQLFTSKPPWQRVLINFAGPATNMALPLLLFTLLMVFGEPQPMARIGVVLPGSAAETAGLLPGDILTEVDGTSVRTWVDVADALALTMSSPLPLAGERDGKPVRFSVNLTDGPVGQPAESYEYGFGNYAPQAILGVDDPSSPAGVAGFRTGDHVTAVDFVPVRDFVDLARALDSAPDQVTLTFTREEVSRDLPITARNDWSANATPADPALWRRWGVSNAGVMVGKVTEESAAEVAGIQAGDRILRVGDRSVVAWSDVTLGVQTAASGFGEGIQTVPIDIEVRRAGQVLTILAHPAVVRDTDHLARYRWRPLLGVTALAGSIEAARIPRPYPIAEAIPRAWNETVTLGSRMVELLGMIFTREAAPSKLIGGPIAVFNQLSAAAEAGIFDLVRQTGFISLSLGIINLVPVPVFDGGQIVMNAAEWLRGRPLPLILRERVQQVGVIFLLVLMFAVVVNDIYRTFLPE